MHQTQPQANTRTIMQASAMKPGIVIASIAHRQLAKPLLLAIGLLLIGLSASAQAAESLIMNLKTQNSTSDPKETPVVLYLPSELAKEDVIESDGLQIRYDDKRRALYLYGSATLAPEESKVYKVVVRDVWRIPQADIDYLKKQTKSRVEYLESTDDYTAGQLLGDQIQKELTQIEAAQSEEMEIPQRIEANRIATEKMDQIKRKITVMSDFVKEARWLKEVNDTTETVKLTVQIKNPLSTQLENQEVIRYLPRGVSPSDVIDPQGFEIKYDPERQIYYLFKLVTLEPGQSLSAVITFKNSWKIPIKRLENLVGTASDYKERLKGSQYEESSNKIFNELEQLANQVKELQAKYDTPADMIANFSLNLTRFNAVEDGVKKLKELVEEIEHPVPQSLPYYIKPATPDVSTTWKIIYGFIGFLTILGLMFYALWWGQSKARLNRKYETHKV
ncbi:MAG: hypothetical protein KBD07_01005 [Candidatus Omnitrophica bacterium]|nr:hypothetical protein [Candidatus Omnitrophota bacterium]